MQKGAYYGFWQMPERAQQKRLYQNSVEGPCEEVDGDQNQNNGSEWNAEVLLWNEPFHQKNFRN